MAPTPDPAQPAPIDALLAGAYQAGFAQRWGSLRDPRVRALAWLLDAPGLLDAGDPGWDGMVMGLGPVTPECARWLYALDQDPAALDAALGPRVFTRLGLYAEKLMAFYFREQGRLLAHGLQVHASRHETVGEFDFLLEREGSGAGVDADIDPENKAPAVDGVEHIEFATKFYLLRAADLASLDALVGPNLADTLGAKMRKIIERQLVLGQHPAAQAVLARPVVQARALVKGWLFYPLPAAGEAGSAPAAPAPASASEGEPASASASEGQPASAFEAEAASAPASESAPGHLRGIHPAHCRGFWCTLEQIPMLPDVAFTILSKLEWLAPFQTGPAPPAAAAILTRAALHTALSAHFDQGHSPVLLALLHQPAGTDSWIESARGFIVPSTWPAKAANPS